MFSASLADLEACEDSELIKEALAIRESAEAVYEVYSLALACGACTTCYHAQCYFWDCVRTDVKQKGCST